MRTTWQSVHEMNEAQLELFAETHKVDMEKDFLSLAQAADYVCAELGLAQVGSTASTELDVLTLAHQERHGGTYGDSLRSVLKGRPELADNYFAESFSVQTTAARTG